MFSSKLTIIIQTSTKKVRKNLRKDYKTWVKKLPCIISGQLEVDPHHLRGIKYGTGMGLKSTDEFILPIMHELHQELHTIGSGSFQEKYHVDLECKLVELHKKFVQRL